MMHRLSELRLQRGRLLERVTTQRFVLIAQVQPVRVALGRTDRALASVRNVIDYVKSRPVVTGLAVSALFAFNTRRILRLARRGFVIWRTWRILRERLMLLGWQGFR